MDHAGGKTEPAPSMRVARSVAQWVLLRAGGGECGQSGGDAPAGRTAPGATHFWQSQADGAAAARRLGDQSQAGGAVDGLDGAGDGVSQALAEPAGGRASDLPVPAGRAGNHGSGSGLVQRHHVCSDGARVHVLGGDHGLVEPVCRGVGVVQQPGQRILHPGLECGGSAGTKAADREHRSREPIHERSILGGGGIGRGGREHGWPGPLDRIRIANPV